MGDTTSSDRLLCLDNEQDICDFVTDVAERLGFAARSAVSYVEFRRLCHTFDPTVICLDLQMPDVDGIEVMRYLAGERCRAQILIMSGFDPKVLNTAKRFGATLGLTVTGALQKPIPVADLERELAGMLSAVAAFSPSDLADAIAAGQLQVRYQPKVSLGAAPPGPGSARLVGRDQDWPLAGLEALVRWNHPTHGLVGPDLFIPYAEKTGLIEPLTKHVVETVMTQINAWQGKGFRPPIAINFAAHVLTELDFPDRLAEQVRRHGVDCSQVILEVTETGAMTDAGRSMDILSRVRLKGFGLSMDDFGTGYSSLVQLYRMPFTELKIDKSFVMDVTSSEEARAIVRSVISLAHNLGTTVCAEGVEDGGTLGFLSQEGCDKAQGYYFGRPVPADELMAAVRLGGPLTEACGT